MPYWSVSVGKQIHRFLRLEGSVMITQWFHISLCVGKGTFEQDWNRTTLEETDILIPHKDSIEQKCQVRTLFF